MISAWTVIEARELDSTATSVTFNTGLGSYTFFRLTCYGIKGTSNGNPNITFNGDTGNNYAMQRTTATSTTVTGARDTGIAFYNPLRGPTLDTGSEFLFEFTWAKPLSGQHCWGLGTATGNQTARYTIDTGMAWENTSAFISSVTITASAGNFAVGSVFVLEGA